MKTGIEFINQERKQQIEKHGYSTEFQKTNFQWYSDDELQKAAKFCLDPKNNSWPYDWDWGSAIKILEKDKIGRLSCAGAFFLADTEMWGTDNKKAIDDCASEINRIIKDNSQLK